MRNLARMALCGLFITSFAFTACGDDEKTPADTSPTDTADTADTADTTPDTSTLTNACNNAEDLPVIGANDPAAKASACGADTCLSTLFTSIDDYEACVQSCMLNDQFAGHEFKLSTDCSTCYTKSVRCTAEFCGLDDPNKSCVPTSFGGKGPSSDECNACRDANGCVTSFIACSGLTPTAN